MACWVGISDMRDWWSVTPSVMHRKPPFWSNQYMSHHHFSGILASLEYTSRAVHYVDGLLYMRQMEESWNKNMAD